MSLYIFVAITVATAVFAAVAAIVSRVDATVFAVVQRIFRSVHSRASSSTALSLTPISPLNCHCICLEAFCDSDPSTVTSCKHEFHFQCILEWYCSLAFSVNCLVLYYSENYGYSFGISLHDLVATPDLVNKADVESMGRNGYENPSLPTVPETHYVETASHREQHWWSSLDLFLVATTSSSKLGRESFIDLNLPAPAEQDDANQFEDSAISDAEFVNSVKVFPR
ncbi:hypothetical protein Ahy_B02g060125 [Arachis hypogaea]|uniref:RING-type E3 ubiquitin transferase n=1 Tax=Arachis hypogaea TaxID=3818 RepID=A0A445AHV1_ARAHY|nr:hypothetical protein Ahy_B02g060125 [Arachis hypogaea]